MACSRNWSRPTARGARTSTSSWNTGRKIPGVLDLREGHAHADVVARAARAAGEDEGSPFPSSTKMLVPDWFRRGSGLEPMKVTRISSGPSVSLPGKYCIGCFMLGVGPEPESAPSGRGPLERAEQPDHRAVHHDVCREVVLAVDADRAVAGREDGALADAQAERRDALSGKQGGRARGPRGRRSHERARRPPGSALSATRPRDRHVESPSRLAGVDSRANIEGGSR
jgi:hypothetical protein